MTNLKTQIELVEARIQQNKLLLTQLDQSLKQKLLQPKIFVATLIGSTLGGFLLGHKKFGPPLRKTLQALPSWISPFLKIVIP